MTDKKWNEANTVSTYIYPYLQEHLGYPERKNKHYVDEQTYVRKRGGKSGPYDFVFKDKSGVLLLVEAKKEGHKVGTAEANYAFNYALGGSFTPLPPPYVLVSNGYQHRWYQRYNKGDDNYCYNECAKIPWRHALEARAGGELTENLSLKRIVKLLQKIRIIIFEDLKKKYFPRGFLLNRSLLGRRMADFERILNTRSCFIDPTLSKIGEAKAVQTVLSSIALSLTLKVLFIKIHVELSAESFPINIRQEIDRHVIDYPGILKAKPYDVLVFSDACSESLYELLNAVSISPALVFQPTDNPIGDIWDGLIETEEQDLQVKSLGNVYTPPDIVRAMVDAAEHALGNWRDKLVLEPACGSGHFVRELYKRMQNAYLGKSGSDDSAVEAHKLALRHLRAIDIDPFAAQTTQLGMFLELRKKTGVWKRLAPTGKFDLSRYVLTGDTLQDELGNPLSDMKFDLVIGNPPYGVDVTEETKNHYGLESRDSYGCFIARGISLLRREGHLVLVTSSTFLTARTHRLLREKIYLSSNIRSIHVLHRHAFINRDVFPCLIHLQKKSDRDQSLNIYIFTDAWPIHPEDADYKAALDNWSGVRRTRLPEIRFGCYMMSESLCRLRLMPPSPKDVIRTLSGGSCATRAFLRQKKKPAYAITGGLPSLALFTSDVSVKNRVRECRVDFPGVGEVEAIEVRRGKKWVRLIKLWQLAQALEGLATADDYQFLRKSPGIIPNARRRNIRDVDLRCIVRPKDLDRLSDDEKQYGIAVVDRHRDRYFVPFDKGGESDIDKGSLRAYWSHVDYWIDWSKQSVSLLKKRNSWPVSKPKKTYIRNSHLYFRRGIRFSTGGVYAPVFEISFGGVFSHTGNLIIPFDNNLINFLMPILCSRLIRYVIKNFLQIGVKSEIDVIRQIPIAVPTLRQRAKLEKLCQKIIAARQRDRKTTAWERAAERFVCSIYRIPLEDRREIDTWFKRRYPNFGQKKRRGRKATSSTLR